jgi:carboxypeptidase Taq
MNTSTPQPDAYARVSHRFGLAARLDSARAMLNWDAQTQMPRGGAAARGEHMAALTEVALDLIGGDAAGDELAEAEAMRGALEADEQADLIEMRRIRTHAAAAPKELAVAKARLAQTLQSAWVQAKADDDFKAWAGPFTEMLALAREIAAAKAAALGTSPYGAMIDEFDPGVGEAMIEPVFADLAAFLPPLIDQVRERQASWPEPIPLPAAPPERQAALARRLAVAVGHSPEHFRIDAAPHPFSVPGSPGDVRFTTRYDTDDPRFVVMATLHEAGHAMYEFNLPRRLSFRPAGRARGMTVHESQSLGLEMLAGRSREFLGFLGGVMAETLGGPAEAYAPDNLTNIWRRLDDGFVRVSADEISYPLHVIVRYRLEKAMVAGDLAVGDLPGAWNEQFQALLGRTPPSHTLGVLQDIHWSAGHIGYFPNYAMGAMLAAQLFEAARAARPDLAAALARGDLAVYLDWIRPRIHARASLTDVDTLIREATGTRLQTVAFRRHVERRYLQEGEPMRD